MQIDEMSKNESRFENVGRGSGCSEDFISSNRDQKIDSGQNQPSSNFLAPFSLFPLYEGQLKQNLVV